jgi:hypothetical protein
MPESHKMLETRSGKGDVHDTNGHLVGVAEYELHLFRESHKSPDGAPHSFDEIDGTITGIDATSRVGEPLVLTLEDGRKFPFYFEDSSGTIIARGDMERGEG